MSKSIPNSARFHNSFSIASTVTMLTCTGNNFAAKTHRLAADGSLITDGFNAGMYFDHEEVEFSDLYGLFDIITNASADPKKLIIRGRLRVDAPQRSDGLVRRCSRKQSDGEEPFFEDADRTSVMLDFDKVDNPDGLPPTSIEAMEYLRSLLPTEFHDVECIYSLSASAGLSESDRISGHLWFVFNRPVSNQELKVWLSDYPVDKALFRTVQAHYIASPVFQDGLVDPVDLRNGLLSGSKKVVTVPEIDTSKPAYEYRGDGRGLEAAHGYEAKMALLGDGDGKEGCHAVITSAVAAYMTRHGPQADREALKDDIRARAAETLWDRAAHPVEYVAHEVSDHTLDRSIQDWVDKTFTHSEGYARSEKVGRDVARIKVSEAVDRFIKDAKQWHDQQGRSKTDGKLRATDDGEPVSSFISIQHLFPPPRHGLAGQVALGKTEMILKKIPELVGVLRKGHCVLIAVPNHKLSHELIQRLAALEIETEVYLGPSQDDPDQPDKTMCWVPDDLTVFQSAGVANKLCSVCPHRGDCGYQKQRQKKAQVWICAHQIIYRKRRPPIPPVDFLFIDEDPIAAGFENRLLSSADVPKDIKKAIEMLTIGKAFNRDDFNVSDLRLRQLRKIALNEIEEVELPEGYSELDLEKASSVAKNNSKLAFMAQFYRAILNEETWGMRAAQNKEGSAELRWTRQRRIHSDFEIPTLFADATAHWDATRHIIDCDQSPPGYKGEPWIDIDGSISFDYDYPLDPVISPISVVKAETPHVSYRQVLYSSAAGNFDHSSTGRNNVLKVLRYIEGRSIYYQRVLVICQKSLESILSKKGLPPNVETAHFNNVRGRDEWNNIDLLIVIGRTQPPPAAMELSAEALFLARSKTLGPDYYERVWTPLTNTNTEVGVEQHPDQLVEIMRWRVCEAELIQAIGRGRGVNRESTSPLQVDLINKVPLPDIEIDEVVEWDDAHPDPGEVIIGRYGLMLTEEPSKGTANVVAALLPDLFSSPNAAKKVKVYRRCQTPNKYYLLGVPHRLYTSGPKAPAAPVVALKAPNCKFAVLAQTLRPPTRRPLKEDEMPPTDADVNEDGVLSYGEVYVLKQIPRRLKAKLL